MKYQVRFNLGRGDNYMKWQVKNVLTKEVNHYDPLTHNLLLSNCLLSNKKESALKIYNGHNKYVCAWIKCDNYIVTKEPLKCFSELSFNPRKSPNWIDSENDNIDGNTYHLLVSKSNKVFTGYKK